MSTAIHGDKAVTRTSTHLCQVEYRAAIGQAAIDQFPSGIRIWDTPQSAVSGGEVMHILSTPARVDVVAEQCEPFSETPERVKIRYEGLEGWILAVVLTPVA